MSGQPICPACGRPFTRATRLLVDHLPSTKTTDRATVYHAPSEPISCETSWAETHAQFSRVAREGRSRRR